MKTGVKLLLLGASFSLAGCATPPTSVQVTQLEARVRALEEKQDLQLARTQVLIRAVEQSPQFAELEADGIFRGLELLKKGFEQ